MKRIQIVLVAFIVISSVSAFSPPVIAQSVDERGLPSGPVRGEYFTFGGTAGDITPPRSGDVKVGFIVGGQIATDMYGYLGPASQQTACVPDDEEIRTREDVTCIRNKITRAVLCHFGLDMTTGRSTWSIVC